MDSRDRVPPTPLGHRNTSCQLQPPFPDPGLELALHLHTQSQEDGRSGPSQTESFLGSAPAQASGRRKPQSVSFTHKSIVSTIKLRNPRDEVTRACPICSVFPSIVSYRKPFLKSKHTKLNLISSCLIFQPPPETRFVLFFNKYLEWLWWAQYCAKSTHRITSF